MNDKLKNLIKYLSFLGLDINLSFDRGISFLGINISKSKYKLSLRGILALNKCVEFSPKEVLDVGSGGGEHALLFAKTNAKVTCIDLGTSVYAKKSKNYFIDNIEVINTDFLTWETNNKYDLVWASHILEHQRNVGIFIEKLASLCSSDGHIAITVPYPHRNIWGGHLNLWTPGLLAYNCVMCGFDLSDAIFLYGYREISVIFKQKKVMLPVLTYDKGDVIKLSKFFPKQFKEDSDSWF